jgi:2-polyprenyl-3-methyl-5-hydroxy-6-metoxy-1,4-benzoquinol methylase
MSDQGTEGILSPFLKAQRMKRVRRYIRGRVLDYGCGTGDLGLFCDPAAYTGFDADLHILRAAREKHPGLNFVEQLPASGRTSPGFDTILLVAVIEHVDHPAGLLQELRGLLNPGGRIVLTTPHASLGWAHALGAQLGIFSREASHEHKALLDRRSIGVLAGEAGLKVSEYERFLLGANQLIVLES